MKPSRAIFFFKPITRALACGRGLAIFGLALGMLASGCAPSAMPLSALPVTDHSAKFAVREYALVEQSADNPTHVDFQQRVPAAVAAHRDGWGFPGAADNLDAANQALAPFDFQLDASTTAPFGSYTLARGGKIVKKDIVRFWPVTVEANAAGSSRDFVLPFVTLDGEKLAASTTGIYPWPGQASEERAPAYYGEPIAYAVTDSGSLSVFSGPSLIYAAPEKTVETGGEARRLFTWNKGASQHWALEIGGQVIIDGHELDQAFQLDETFGLSVLQGEPFYLYTSDGLTRISYAGKSLPYVYDQVIHNQDGALQIYNPGSNSSVTWFYGLRDGLWYYVEAGLIE